MSFDTEQTRQKSPNDKDIIKQILMREQFKYSDYFFPFIHHRMYSAVGRSWAVCFFLYLVTAIAILVANTYAA